jgi:hypothetical protein
MVRSHARRAAVVRGHTRLVANTRLGDHASIGRCLIAADFLDDSVGSQDWFCEGEVVVDFCLRADLVEVARDSCFKINLWHEPGGGDAADS